MYAVIETGGKQYRVELGSEIQVDHLDVQPGEAIELDRVLLVTSDDETAVGRPVVDGASVSATVLRQERGNKVVVFKYKPKARARVKKGFRAELTRLRIADITFAGGSAAAAAESSAARQAEAMRAAEQAAEHQAAADRELATMLAAAQETEEPTGKAGSTRKTGAGGKAAAGSTAKAASRAKAAPAATEVEPQAAEGSPRKAPDSEPREGPIDTTPVAGSNDAVEPADDARPPAVDGDDSAESTKDD